MENHVLKEIQKKITGSFTVRLNLFGKVDYSFVVFLFVKDVYVNFVA